MMMNLLRAVAGIVAVAFSIQPLAGWAANSGNKSTQDDKKIRISAPQDEKGDSTQSGGSPLCGGGG